MADTAAHLYSWSTTLGSNLPTGSTTIGTNLAPNLQTVQQVMRYELATRGTIASASTTDLGTKDEGCLEVTGTTTITSFGTVSAGVRKLLRFADVLTLTHNATSLKCITAANIATVAGDFALVESLGSGNWEMLAYWRRSGEPVAVQSYRLSDLSAMAANQTLANAAYALTWGWTFTGNDQTGVVVNGKSNGSGTYGHLFTVAHTDNGFGVQTMFRVRYTNAVGTQTIFSLDPTGTFSLAGGTSSAAGSNSTITAQHAETSSASNGGNLTLMAGNGGATGAGGTLLLQGSGGSTKGAVRITNSAGSVSLTINSSAPTISSGGGTGGSVRGIDNAFEVTFGTGNPSSVVIDFGTTKGGIPICSHATTHTDQVTVTATADDVTISSATAFASGAKVGVHCFDAT